MSKVATYHFVMCVCVCVFVFDSYHSDVIGFMVILFSVQIS